MSIAYLDPGNIESDLQAGSLAQYQACVCVLCCGGGGGGGGVITYIFKFLIMYARAHKHT